SDATLSHKDPIFGAFLSSLTFLYHVPMLLCSTEFPPSLLINTI
ncbi:6998_t:CDS:1, partial [Racocetra persica]